MEWRKEHGPAYTVLKVFLEPGESVTAEPGALMLYKGDIEVKTTSGRLGAALRRALLGGESFFMNTYYAVSKAEIWFVPGTPGDIEAIELGGEEWFIQDTSYLAHHGDIEVSAGFRGLRGFLAEGEFFWLKVSGAGTVWVSSYGAIEKIEVPSGEHIVVDNYHLVAMPASTSYEIRKFGGLKSFLFGGEGFVVEIEGPATVLVQTRILPPLARLLSKYLPKRS